jgi:phospholipid N-methyltransferase
MDNIWASYGRFLVAGLLRHHQTGGIVPSQRYLVETMIAPVPREFAGHILELGVGTGALTLRLAKRCPAAQIIGCEINPALARDAQARLAAAGLEDRVTIKTEPAEVFMAQWRRQEKTPFDFLFSGIPLGNVPGPQAEKLIQSICQCLRPGGMYVQFQHSLLDRKRIKAAFRKLRTIPVLANFPPAFVYYACK